MLDHLRPSPAATPTSLTPVAFDPERGVYLLPYPRLDDLRAWAAVWEGQAPAHPGRLSRAGGRPLDPRGLASVRPAHTPEPDGEAPARRPITANLTPLAPGMAGVPLEHPDRWRTWTGVRPELAVRGLLELLGQGPADVGLRTQPLGCVALMGRAHGFPCVPLAFVTSGLAEAELQAILDGLALAGWRPSPSPGLSVVPGAGA